MLFGQIGALQHRARLLLKQLSAARSPEAAGICSPTVRRSLSMIYVSSRPFVSNTETTLDIRPYFSYKPSESRSRGKPVARVLLEAERERMPARGTIHFAPGRPWAPLDRHEDRPARSSLDWDRPTRAEARLGHVPGNAVRS